MDNKSDPDHKDWQQIFISVLRDLTGLGIKLGLAGFFILTVIKVLN